MHKVDVPFGCIKPLFRYPEELMGLRCYQDLLRLELFPNMKEFTESMAAYNAVRKFKPFGFGDPDVVVVAVGDGHSPRTAALFAFRTAWSCHSVDPLMKDKWTVHTGVDRLQVHKMPIEGFIETTRMFGEPPVKKLVVVAVHSHASLRVACNGLVADERFVVAIPCCVPQERERPPDYKYVDYGIWSPENRVLVWHDGQEAARWSR